MLIYSVCPVVVQCIFLLEGRKSCDTVMLKTWQSGVQEQSDPPWQTQVPTHCSSFGSAVHFRYRSTLCCQRQAPYPTVRETKTSTCPLYLFLFLFLHLCHCLSLCLFQVSCASMVLILTACFSPQSAEFS